MSQIGSNINLKFETESVFAFIAMNKAGSALQGKVVIRAFFKPKNVQK